MWQAGDVIWSGTVQVCGLLCCLCDYVKCSVTLAGYCSGLPALQSLLPVQNENVRQCLVMFSHALAVPVRKPTLQLEGSWSIPSSQLEALGGRQNFPIFTSTQKFIRRSPHTVTCSFFCSISSTFGRLLHPWWEQTVSLLNNSHHFHLILSYHGQFSSWIILWKIHLLSLRVMNLERWRVE